jgi:hypothetical protein
MPTPAQHAARMWKTLRKDRKLDRDTAALHIQETDPRLVSVTASYDLSISREVLAEFKKLWTGKARYAGDGWQLT